MFWNLFTRRSKLVPSPSARVKTYSALSGYVYRYVYLGYQPLKDNGTEFVFRFSADNKRWATTAVAVPGRAVEQWQARRGRELGASERYGLAKMGLFQAFDEGPAPAQMAAHVRLDEHDLEELAERLGLD